MKYRKKYSYFVSAGLLMLMIILIISHKDNEPSPNVAIAEDSVNVTDEKKSYLSGRDISERETAPPGVETAEEETAFAIPETAEEETTSAVTEIPEEETASAISEIQEETQTQTEAERPPAIEGIPGYEYTYLFPADIVFASEESVKLMADIYDEIGFEGEFQPGDEAVYEFYRQKFALLLDGMVKVYDRKGNESSLYDRYIPKGPQHQIRADEIYFFDMDGDGLPELCVQGTSGIYVCKYDAGSDRYTEWWGGTNSGCMILGTRRITEDHCGDTEYLYLLNKDGYTECRIIFNIVYKYDFEKLYLVSIPDFEERVHEGKIPDSMKQQVVYDEFQCTYYLRVTCEQYEELIKGLYEAREKAKPHQVPFSYFFDSED